MTALKKYLKKKESDKNYSALLGILADIHKEVDPIIEKRRKCWEQLEGRSGE